MIYLSVVYPWRWWNEIKLWFNRVVHVKSHDQSNFDRHSRNINEIYLYLKLRLSFYLGIYLYINYPHVKSFRWAFSFDYVKFSNRAFPFIYIKFSLSLKSIKNNLFFWKIDRKVPMRKTATFFNLFQFFVKWQQYKIARGEMCAIKIQGSRKISQKIRSFDCITNIRGNKKNLFFHLLSLPHWKKKRIAES